MEGNYTMTGNHDLMQALAGYAGTRQATDSAKARLRREINAGRVVKLSDHAAWITKRWPDLAGPAAAIAEKAAKEFASRSRL
jgi:hypothetical protein